MDKIHLKSEEYFELLRELDARHGLFYHLWDMGAPVFSDSISTAGVRLDDTGECLEFLLNEKLWNLLNLDQKIFVLCHECLHVALNHGYRLFRNVKDKKTFKKLNWATDVVINHTLVDKFGMDRTIIDPENKYCWLDTVFTEKDNVLPKKSSEYYFNKIKNTEELSSPETVDDHNFFENSDEHSDMKDILEKINDNLSDDEKEFLDQIIEDNKKLDEKMSPDDTKSQNAGSSPGNIFSKVEVKEVKKKKKWETVIKKWANQFIVEKDKDELQWARTSRRMALISPDMFLPSEMEIEDTELEKRKIEVWFFQDTSASCKGYAQRFFDAARSLPEDKFDIRMFCFDTRVYETTLKSGKLYGFGGTTFTCIENYISKNSKEYPKAVFIITDGYGDVVNPKKPENWYWFLTPNGGTYCIPNKSHTFDLKNYE